MEVWDVDGGAGLEDRCCAFTAVPYAAISVMTSLIELQSNHRVNGVSSKGNRFSPEPLTGLISISRAQEARCAWQ